MAFKISSILTTLLLIQCLPLLCHAQGFDFFYFVLQWPGSYCDTLVGCCYPTTGKPAADFAISGFWPYNNDGTFPSNCDPGNPYDESQISDLISRMQQSWPSLACPSDSGSALWSQEWDIHGTCSESVLDQHGYFQAALNLKDQLINILQILEDAGIRPDGGTYSLTSITNAIENAIGLTPGVECNVDATANNQLYQIYFCVDTSGSNLIACPVLPIGNCASSVTFPSF